MKKLALTILLSGIWLLVSANIPGEGDLEKRADIHLKDGNVLTSVGIYEVRTYRLVYEKDRTLHDLLLQDIEQIVTDEHIIRFDDDGEYEIHEKEDAEEAKTDEETRKDKKLKKLEEHYYRPSIKTTPISLIFNRHFRLAFEKPVDLTFRDDDKHQSLLVEGGYMHRTNDLDYGFDLRTELKLYLDRLDVAPNISNLYYAPQLFYEYKNKQSIYNSNYTNAIGLRFKFGAQTVFDNNFVIEYYGGMGLKGTHITYDDNAELESGESFDLSPSYTLGLRIGFAL